MQVSSAQIAQNRLDTAPWTAHSHHVTDRLLSSAEVADLLGVSPASVKRWADAGVLPCVKTAGHHRRFRRDVVDHFRRSAAPAQPVENELTVAPSASAWADEMLRSGDEGQLEARLLNARAELGSWWRVADRIGPALNELGRRWQLNQITVADEHRASERFSRSIARLGAWMPQPPNPPRCLLAAATGDEHTLGLSLVELCVRERGWAPVWIGRSAPVSDIAASVARLDVRVCALSASCYSSHRHVLAQQAEQLGLACAAYGVTLVLGGSGNWPEAPAHGRVIRDFATFSELLASLNGV